MKTLIFPTYFPSISHYVALVKNEKVVLEIGDHFQKQTNRNRMYIHSPNGKQLLNIPVKHALAGNQHQKTKDVRIENDFGWQKQHFKSMEAAYRTSPYFEYFEDDFRPIFEKKHTFLLDLNLEVFAMINDALGLKITIETSDVFEKNPDNCLDARNLANGKKDNNIFETYTQVFDDKNGFINNLSIFDLLCNEGRHAVAYLKSQPLIIPK
ncbi:MAG: WbqC family protein [Flavobacterium sp.]